MKNLLVLCVLLIGVLLSAGSCEKEEGTKAVHPLVGTWYLQSEEGGWGHSAQYSPSSSPERLAFSADSTLRVYNRDSLDNFTETVEIHYSSISQEPKSDSPSYEKYTLNTRGDIPEDWTIYWLKGDSLTRLLYAPSYDGTAYTYARLKE